MNKEVLREDLIKKWMKGAAIEYSKSEDKVTFLDVVYMLAKREVDTYIKN